jgi:hypothetical protein
VTTTLEVTTTVEAPPTESTGPALPTTDPDDVDGKLDVRNLNATRTGDLIAVSLTTYEPWSSSILAGPPGEQGPNRITILYDVDLDGTADYRGRVIEAGGELSVSSAGRGRSSSRCRSSGRTRRRPSTSTRSMCSSASTPRSRFRRGRCSRERKIGRPIAGGSRSSRRNNLPVRPLSRRIRRCCASKDAPQTRPRRQSRQELEPGGSSARTFGRRCSRPSPQGPDRPSGLPLGASAPGLARTRSKPRGRHGLTGEHVFV